MNKIKKLFIAISVFITGLLSKIPVTLAVQTKYGIAVDPSTIEDKYVVFEPTMGEKISKIGKLAIPVLLFTIGLFVVLSKKITKKVKTIVISILVILAIFGYAFMNYIATNF